MELLSGQQLVVVDTETTGFSPADGHALVEVATVVIRDGKVVDGESWSSLMHPGRPIPADATAIHGITDAMVAGATAVTAIAAELRRRCADSVLVFHNAAFDLAFLAALMRKNGQLPFGNPVVDTLGLAKRLLGAGGNSLEELAVKLGLQAQPRHRAREDAEATAQLFLKLAEQLNPNQQSFARSLIELAADSQDALRHAPSR